MVYMPAKPKSHIQEKRMEKYTPHTFSVPNLKRQEIESQQQLHLDLNPWNLNKTFSEMEEESGDDLII